MSRLKQTCMMSCLRILVILMSLVVVEIMVRLVMAMIRSW